MQEILELINRELKDLEIDYHYLINTADKVIYPYVTGEYHESGYSYEDNANTAEMTLEAWNRGSILELIELTKKIKDKFRDYRANLDNMAVHISYAGNYPRRTGDISLNKMEIYLDIKYWEGVKE